MCVHGQTYGDTHAHMLTCTHTITVLTHMFTHTGHVPGLAPSLPTDKGVHVGKVHGHPRAETDAGQSSGNSGAAESLEFQAQARAA